MEATRAENRIHVGHKTATINERTSTMALTVFYSVGIIIGIWSFVALIGALVTGEGPLGLVKGYFQAVTGL